MFQPTIVVLFGICVQNPAVFNLNFGIWKIAVEYSIRHIEMGHQLFDAVRTDALAALKFIDRRDGFGVRNLDIEGDGLLPRDPH